MTIFGVWYGIKKLQHRVMDRPPYGFEGKRKSPQFARFQKGDFLKKAGFLNQTGAQPRPESVKQIKKVILGRQSFFDHKSRSLCKT